MRMKKAVDNQVSFLYFAASVASQNALKHSFDENHKKKMVDTKAKAS